MIELFYMASEFVIHMANILQMLIIDFFKYINCYIYVALAAISNGNKSIHDTSNNNISTRNFPIACCSTKEFDINEKRWRN